MSTQSHRKSEGEYSQLAFVGPKSLNTRMHFLMILVVPRRLIKETYSALVTCKQLFGASKKTRKIGKRMMVDLNCRQLEGG